MKGRTTMVVWRLVALAAGSRKRSASMERMPAERFSSLRVLAITAGRWEGKTSNGIPGGHGVELHGAA